MGSAIIRSDSSIADLHYTLQILMNWDDCHLHQFRIHGKRYGITRPGGISFSDNPHQTLLTQFHAVEDRVPRVYPWRNEPEGGILMVWNISRQLIASTIFNITWCGCANTAEES